MVEEQNEKKSNIWAIIFALVCLTFVILDLKEGIFSYQTIAFAIIFVLTSIFIIVTYKKKMNKLF